ncbi:MAG: YggS family pyridoxal phosphate-dependent enzyme [Cyclobacteriaceae bacterium]|nr:YggS family pyridoxal phosphate-dependent enzyme [Cyclobacteriaceae bacterium]UYN87985.1 MAG: YggS family pyridoxal phosphate-dependent enzyme [Cyclobacteriaceae bacterium]
MNIKNNIAKCRQNLPENVTLIAVSKTQPVTSIQEAYDAGQRVFGENKAQEMKQKYDVLPKDIQWHMIGHLQTNKVKYIAPFVHLIHSIDSLKLLVEINKQAQKVGRVIPCLLQLHIAEEDTKFGFSRDELLSLLNDPEFTTLANIKITGLMGMATFTDNTEQIRKEFRSLKLFFDELKTKSLPPTVQLVELSMGMSGDYPIALEEGSTMIRIGTAIFGERQYKNA